MEQVTISELSKFFKKYIGATISYTYNKQKRTGVVHSKYGKDEHERVTINVKTQDIGYAVYYLHGGNSISDITCDDIW